jgi:type I restriction enzyme, S subunit
MNNDWFFEKFALIADAPGAVATMRGLVLDLAVTGKLVDQAKHDQHASVILESALTERAAFEADRTIKARSSAPVRSEDEPYKLPSNWIWARLAQIGYELGQQIPDKRFTYIDVGGIDAKKGQISNQLEVIESENAPSRARKKVALGTVIYSTVRPYLRNIAIVTDQFDPEPIASTAFGILHPFSGINNRYVFYWLRSDPFTEYVEKCMKGMAYPAINDEKFYSGYIPLPPLAEQKRIVAKVDELMGLCDVLEAQQQERELRKSVLVRSSLSRFAEVPTPENLGYLFHKSYDIPPSELRKSILTLAIQGKLVPQDPNDEPAVAIKMQIAKRMSAIRNQRHHTFAATEDQTDPPFPIPHNWEWMPFGTLGEFLGGGTPSKDNPAYWNGEIPWVSPKDMKRPYICDSIDHVTSLGADASSGRLIPTGALLMVVRGMILAHTFPVAITTREVTINQDMKALRLTVPEIGEYLLRCCTALTGAMLSNVERSSHGTCRIPTEVLSSFLVPIPPLAEQRRIVAKVDQLMALVDELERQQDESREKATKLLDAIVHEITSGGQGIAATLES